MSDTDDHDVHIAHLKQEFETSQAVLRQMDHFPELLFLLGKTDKIKELTEGTASAADCEEARTEEPEVSENVKEANNANKLKLDDGILKRNLKLTSEVQPEDTSPSKVSDRKHTDAAPEESSRDCSIEEHGVLPNGRKRYFTRTRRPVVRCKFDTSHYHESDPKSSVLRGRKRNEKQKQVDAEEQVEAKKRKTATNGPPDATVVKLGVQSNEMSDEKICMKSVDTTCNNKADRNKVVGSCPATSESAKLTAALAALNYGRSGPALYQQMLGDMNNFYYYSIPAPGTAVSGAQGPHLFYGPTVIGENGTGYNYVWAPPAWLSQYPVSQNGVLTDSAWNSYYPLARVLYSQTAGSVTHRPTHQISSSDIPVERLSTSDLQSSTSERKSTTAVL